MHSNLHQLFRSFHAEHAGRLFAYAATQGPNPEDILQEAFLELWMKLKECPELNDWCRWMKWCIKLRSIDACRRRNKKALDLANSPREPEQPDPLDSLNDDQPLPDEIVNRPDLVNLVSKAYSMMPETSGAEKQEKLLIRLLYFSGDTCPELKAVAVAMGVGESLAKKRHRTAKASLKRILRSFLD